MPGSKLYVGNLNYTVTSDQLVTLFAEYGEVKDANVIEGRGFGFVEMVQADDAEKAKEALNGTEFEGRTLRIDAARPRQDRPRRDSRR